jgi:hypothetical protein
MTRTNPRCTRCGADCREGWTSFSSTGSDPDLPSPFTLCSECADRLEAFLKRTPLPPLPTHQVPIFKFERPRNLLEKLKADAALLDDEVTSGTLFNFVGPGYHLIDWIKNDASTSQATKQAVESMYQNRWIKVCGDLATASKHHVLSKRTPVTERAETEQGWGIGRYGKDGFGIGEEQITVILTDGEKIDCLDLVKRVVATWEEFFREHDL